MSLLSCSMLHAETPDPDCAYCNPPPPRVPTDEERRLQEHILALEQKLRRVGEALGRARNRYICKHLDGVRPLCFRCMLDEIDKELQ